MSYPDGAGHPPAAIREIRLSPAGDALFLPFASFAAAGRNFSAGISPLSAGDMDLAKRFSDPARARLLAALEIPAERAFAVHQVHSRDVVVLADGQAAEPMAAVDVDGIVTARPDVFLTVTVADCLPVFLVDRATGAFGLVHSGWKGTGIAGVAVRLMGERFGSRPADIAATIGPGIGPCCYTVPEERAQGFAREFGADAVAREAGSPRLDLRRANAGLLERAGVRDIGVVTACTCCSPWLGSSRRAGGVGFTRMLAVIGARAGGG
jgi:polyphenol oxidase